VIESLNPNYIVNPPAIYDAFFSLKAWT